MAMIINEQLDRARPVLPVLGAGMWLVCKARRHAREKGVAQAAANLRKQGVPFELARTILRGI